MLYMLSATAENTVLSPDYYGGNLAWERVEYLTTTLHSQCQLIDRVTGTHVPPAWDENSCTDFAKK